MRPPSAFDALLDEKDDVALFKTKQLENSARCFSALGGDAKQQMLGADILVPEPRRLLASQCECPSHPHGKVVAIHRFDPCCFQIGFARPPASS